MCKRSRSRVLGSREQLPQAAKPAGHVPSTCQSRGRTRAGSYCGSSWECSWRTLIPLSQMRTLTLSQGEELSQVTRLEGQSQDSKESVLSSRTRVRSGRHTSLSLCSVCLSVQQTFPECLQRARHCASCQGSGGKKTGTAPAHTELLCLVGKQITTP